MTTVEPNTTVHNPRIGRTLDTVGDGTGTKAANVDGSITPVVFKINPPTGSDSAEILLTQLLIQIRDDGQFSASKYGNKTALENGIQVGMFDSSNNLVEDYLDGIPVLNNIGWARYSGFIDVKAWGQGDEFLVLQWSLATAGTLTSLRLGDAFSFGVKVRDDLSDLAGHFFTVEGYRSFK